MRALGPGRAARWCSALVVALVAAVPTAHAATGSEQVLEVRSATVADSTVTLTVAAEGLPAGADLDPASVEVRSGDQAWASSAEPLTPASSRTDRRAVLLVDTSGSMGAQDITAIRSAAQAFLDLAPADVAVGVVAFSTEARVLIEPTTDRTAVRDALAGLEGEGDTALFDGLLLALGTLGTDGERTLALLGDGEDNASRATFDAARDALGASGVDAKVVAFTTDRTRVDVLDGLAAAVGGTPIQASDGDQLTDAFAVTARTLVNQVTVTAQVPPGVGGDVPVDVHLTAGDVPLMASTTVALPALPEAPAEPAVPAPQPAPPVVEPTPAAAQPAWAQPAVVGAAFLGLFVLFLVLLSPATWRRSTSKRRTEDIARYGLGGRSATAAVTATPGAVSQAALAWADRRVQRRGLADSWQLLLDRAALPLKAHEWLILRLAAVLAGFAVAVVLLPWWLLTGPLLGLLAWVGTGVFLAVKARRRANQFATHLPDVLQLVAGSLGSGFSFPQAVDNAATEGPAPVSTELARALGTTRLGVPLEDALERVAERMDSTDLAWTVMTVRISREVGGNLGEVLLSTAETMRERGRLRRQVKTLSAEGRLSAYILLGLPIVIALFLSATRPDYLAPLVQHPLGWVMTGGAVLLMTVGSWWMSRLVKLEV